MMRLVVLVAVVLVQLALVGVATAGQLSARLSGTEYAFRVQPVDPIDPFRGAYVALHYPGLRGDTDGERRGALYLPLQQRGKVWVAGEPSRQRPGATPYLTCSDSGWDRSCGIESWFAPQDEALAMEQSLATGADVVAIVRIDGRGNAALVDVRPAG